MTKTLTALADRMLATLVPPPGCQVVACWSQCCLLACPSGNQLVCRH